MSQGLVTKRSILFFLACFSILSLQAPNILAGPYIDSAHGSATTGAFRSIIGNAPPSGLGYSRGNCAHCHEQHASIKNSEPAPDNSGPSPYELFAQNFSGTNEEGNYSEFNNFCFYCHNNAGPAQQVLNNDYSQTFGCAVQGPNSILAAMSQTSSHNLFDIWNFSDNEFPWFTSYSNPCDACHNPHMARQNQANPQDPAFSAMSKPTDHFNLWGTIEEETMANTGYSNKYQPPYCDTGPITFEPADTTVATASSARTPDYIVFCTTCHDQSIVRDSNGQTIEAIDWSSSGDKHGLRDMDGTVSTKLPYDPTSSGTDFVLSCLDCHEPHGSENVMLIRRRVNGSALAGSITTFDTTDWSLLCVKCHKDDAAFGGAAGKWEQVHHDVSDAPYSNVALGPGGCSNCHPAGPGPAPIACQDCHAHGGAVTKADTKGAGIGTFRIGF